MCNIREILRNLAVLFLLFSLSSPVWAITIPRRPGKPGMILRGRTWDAALNSTTGVRLGKISLRVLSKDLNAGNVINSRLTQATLSPALQGAKTGSISIAAGSLKSKSATPVITGSNSLLKSSPDVKSATASLKTTVAQNTQIAVNLKKISQNNLTAKARLEVGSAIHAAESNAAAANARLRQKQLNQPSKKGKGTLIEKPFNLNEQIVLKSALRAALRGGGEELKMKVWDIKRLQAQYGAGDWVKMAHAQRMSDGRIIQVHWFRNKTTKKNREFDFKFRVEDKVGVRKPITEEKPQ